VFIVLCNTYISSCTAVSVENKTAERGQQNNAKKVTWMRNYGDHIILSTAHLIPQELAAQAGLRIVVTLGSKLVGHQLQMKLK